MAKKQQVMGICRICGQHKVMTEEHIIPRVAGGGDRVKLYNGEELLKTLSSDAKPYGRIKQNGHAEYTLCAECNNMSGRFYDEDFADFFNILTRGLPPQISIPKGMEPSEYLEGKRVEIELVGIKPCNIAKRILVSFCSVDHPGLTDRKPEVRKAILEKEYQPSTDDFSLYLSLHVGNPLFFGTVAALNIASSPFLESYAGIEDDVVALYLAEHDEHLKGGNLIKCLDITSWLTRYKYDEIANIQLELMFNKSLTIRFPIPS